ncbi:MAG: DnaA regulatory inactivator Hda [Legionellales bacterium RIFCSPHIGHO2_12_FULL_42_9]|nr:MAG: DnaA regulatory inactivator Hda [Legionellales bacterium RIFCSPHIGHO2_12_FULL_42_9]
MNKQLTLAIQPHHRTALQDFCWGGNIFLKQQLAQILDNTGERLIYIWGNNGCGKTHVLQGVCQTYSEQSQPATSIYIPLEILRTCSPTSLDDLAEQPLIAIDDLDSIAGMPDWEEALLHLYNQVRDHSNGILIMSNTVPPNNSLIRLADLRSRFGWGLVVHLKELHDENKILVLQQQARRRGFELTITVAEFLINHCARNMHALHDILEQLDAESLVAQRKITIPFVKSVLNTP